MQRNKIKVGAEYAVSHFRDWWEYGTQIVQVLDTGSWFMLSGWDERGRSKPSEEVQNPNLKDGFTIQVPGHIRRDEDRVGYRTAKSNLVLVRYISTSKDGEKEYGTPTLVMTRSLVAEWPEAERRIAEHRERLADKRRAEAEKRDRTKSYQERLNERLAALGRGEVGQAYGGRWAILGSDLEALLTLAEEPGEESHCCGH